MAKSQNAHEVIKCIQSHHRVFVHGAAATPNVLLQALVENSDQLKNVELIHLQGKSHEGLACLAKRNTVD